LAEQLLLVEGDLSTKRWKTWCFQRAKEGKLFAKHKSESPELVFMNIFHRKGLRYHASALKAKPFELFAFLFEQGMS